ncbi:MAG: hypothetical protein JAY67_19200 [Candidatus Thiodiazotropha taylori]|nr:hypothetical protein [Candidatus Thiodiazotropha taylori]MCG7927652.1 hypothetical protein [Candidatus Thiodiazotropha taylori]
MTPIAVKILLILVLGVIIAFGLRSKTKTFSLAFTSASLLGVISIAVLYHIRGSDLSDLLLLTIPSKTTSAIFMLYAAIVGGILSTIFNKSRKEVGDD